MTQLARLAALLTHPIKELNAAQLRHLAKLTGAKTSSASKADLAENILREVRAVKDNYSGTPTECIQRVLSIDMGIANLAYCTLERSSNLNILTTIRQWDRLSLLTPEISTNTNKVDFSTPWLAQTATNLVNKLVLSLPQSSQPSHILIERQRWRSMGRANVLQWTIRVNTLEAMLWAALTTLRNQGLWKGQIHAIDPTKVADWWLTSDIAIKRTTSKKYLALKDAKVNLVRDWISTGSYIQSGSPESDQVLHAMQPKPAGRRTKRKDDNITDLGKLDDLADCMVQGVTFLQWLQNREILARREVEGVQELLQMEEQPKTIYN